MRALISLLATSLFLALVMATGPVSAAQVCKYDSIQATAPASRFTDNGDGTVTDQATGLMWKRCSEGQARGEAPSGFLPLDCPESLGAAEPTLPDPTPSTSEHLTFTSGGHVLRFAPDHLLTAGATHALKVEFVGANPAVPQSDTPASHVGSAQRTLQDSPRPPGEGLGVRGQQGFQAGAWEPSNQKAPPLTQVRYSNLWHGIDLSYRAASGGIAESLYQVQPGADINQVRLRYNRPLSLDAEGNLSIRFDSGALTESAPVAWQEIDGQRRSVNVAFVQQGERELGLALDAYDAGKPLWIDPTLSWNTFLGGSSGDSGYAIALDAGGNVYVTGGSEYTWGSPLRAFSFHMDAFVAKLDPNGTLLWNTFLGDIGWDAGHAIALDASGQVYVTGVSSATWGSPLRAFRGGGTCDSYSLCFDVFVAQLDPDGTLLWNTFLGGDDGGAIALDAGGQVYVTGLSYATWGSPLRAHSGYIDAFIAKLDANGTLLWNTFLGDLGGGSSYDGGAAIALDAGGNVYVAGMSDATWGSPLRAFSGGYADAFVAKLNANGALLWNTFLGGSYTDGGTAIALDAGGNVYVAGMSDATWGSPLRAFGGGTCGDHSCNDAFVAKLDPDGALLWNTFLGGSYIDWGAAIALDAGGDLYVTGVSYATWGSPLRAFSGGGTCGGYPCNDAFVAKLDPNGTLLWNTFLGGSSEDIGFAIALNAGGNLYVTGYSGTTWGSPLRAFSGGYDAFVAKLGDPLPYSITPQSTTVNENVGSVSFTLTRSDSTAAQTLYASTVENQGSTNNGDYTGKLNEPVVFAAGETEKTVTVLITDDTTPEGSETFGLILQQSPSDPETTFLAAATFTILDNDTAAPPPVVDAITPTTVKQNHLAYFRLVGSYLPDGLVFNLDGCSPAIELLGGTDLERQFACVPTQTGDLTVTVTDGQGTAVNGGSATIYITPDWIDVPFVDTSSEPSTIALDAKYVVLVTHGWNSSAEAWPNELVRSICSKLGAAASLTPYMRDGPASGRNDTIIGIDQECSVGSWYVASFNWAPRAELSSDDVVLVALTAPEYLPALVAASILTTASAANDLGKRWGKKIPSSVLFVQLIGHSNGSYFTQGFAETVRENYPSLPIQMTLFDSNCRNPFSCGHGEGTTWAEQYFDTHGLLFTEVELKQAYNFDVTSLNSHFLLNVVQNHAFPYNYFIATAGGTPPDQPFDARVESDAFLAANLSAWTSDDKDINPIEWMNNLKQHYPVSATCKVLDKPGLGLLACDVLPIEITVDQIRNYQLQMVNSRCNSYLNDPSKLTITDPNTLTLGNCVSPGLLRTARDETTAQAEVVSLPEPGMALFSVTFVEAVDLLSFDYRFTEENARGTLQVFIDNDQLVYISAQEADDLELHHSGKIDIPTLAPGEHFLRFAIKAGTSESAGVEISNVYFAKAYSATVNVPAMPVITSGPSGMVKTTAASFSFTGDAGVSFECGIDGGAYQPCGSPHSLQVPSNGGRIQVTSAPWGG